MLDREMNVTLNNNNVDGKVKVRKIVCTVEECNI